MNKIIHIKPEPMCPSCGAKMILRRPKEGQMWEPFWGCNRFPDCKGKWNIDFETGDPIDPNRDKVGDSWGWDGDED